MSCVRIIDVIFTGPLQIFVGYKIKSQNSFLSLFMIITGIFTILYNLHNFCYINMLCISRNYFGIFTHPIHGKQQWHRLYNIFVMYPLFFIVYLNYPIETPFMELLLLNILIGFGYNAYNWFILHKSEISKLD
jgi:hypothetical protein